MTTENALKLLLTRARKGARTRPKARAMLRTLDAGILAASTGTLLFRMLSARELMGG